MRIIHEIGKYIGIEQDGVERLRYNYSLMDDPTPSAPKPFIHPIRTPDGNEITAHSPLDHFWHRGLWFTFKYVNGINYWEENQEIVGQQSTLSPPTLTVTAHDSVCWKSQLAWWDMAEGTRTVRLTEERAVECRLLPEGDIVLDWSSTLQPTQPVVLDRTPYVTWGGYGGLYLRMTQALQKQTLILAGETAEDAPEVASKAVGTSHRWAAIFGQLDMHSDRGQPVAGFVFFPAPENRRFPEPFYGDAKPFYNFFGPAPLFHEPLSLEVGEKLVYSVQVWILSRSIKIEEIEECYKTWVDRV